MKRFVLLVLAAMLTVSASCLSVIAGRSGSQKNLVILGDSIATGFGLPGYNSSGNPKAKTSWSTLLAERYDAKQYNLAVDGDTISDLIDELQTSKNGTKLASADVVCLSIGGNNFLRLFDEASDAGFLKFFSTLVNSAEAMLDAAPVELDNAFSLIKQKSPNATVLVQTLYNPFRYWTVSLGGTSLGDWFGEYITRYNEILKEKILAYGFVCIDVYQKFQNDNRKDYLYDAMAVGNIIELLSRIDQIDPHPTEAGHRAIYDAYVATADSLLQQALTVETTVTTTAIVTTTPKVTTTPEVTTTAEETTTVLQTTMPSTEATVLPETFETTLPYETSPETIEQSSVQQTPPVTAIEEQSDPSDTVSAWPTVAESSEADTTEADEIGNNNTDKIALFGVLAAAVVFVVSLSVVFRKLRKDTRKDALK